MSELSELDDGFAELEQLAAGQRPSATIVRFFIEAMEDEVASKASGTRVFRDVEMIEKRNPGDRDVVRREVREKDKRQYAAIYLAFKRNQSQDAVSGFPLREWAQIKKSEAETLIAAGVKTVEQLAGASLDNIKSIGHFANLQQRAKDFLAQQKDSAEVARLRNRLDDTLAQLKATESMLLRQSQELEAARSGNVPAAAAGPDPRISALEAQIAALAAAVKPAEPKRRGRPPKAKPETEN